MHSKIDDSKRDDSKRDDSKRVSSASLINITKISFVFTPLYKTHLLMIYNGLTEVTKEIMCVA